MNEIMEKNKTCANCVHYIETHTLGYTLCKDAKNLKVNECGDYKENKFFNSNFTIK